MDKIKNRKLQNLKQNMFARGLLLSSLGLGLTACSDTGLNQFAQNNGAWQNMPPHQAAAYYPNKQAQPPYIQMVQNNSISQLRGPSQIRDRILQQYNYDDSPTFYAATPLAVQASNIPQTYTANPALTADPRQYFKHHLGDAAPRVVRAQNLARPISQQGQPSYVAPPVQAPQPAQTYQPVQTNHSGISQIYGPQQSYPQPVGQQQPPAAPVQAQPVYQTTATSLSQSLNTALQQSPRLAIEDIKIQEAEEQLEQARSQGRFKLNLEGSAGPTQNETDFRVIDRTDTDFRVRRSANLNLSLPLYQGGRLTAQRNVAKVDIETAKANYQAVESDVAVQTGIAHLNVLRDRALIEVYKRNVVLLQNQKNTVQALLAAGENTITDEALVDARLASIQARLEQAQSNLSASESRYKKLTGLPTPALSPIQPVELPTTVQAAKDEALKNNAQLQAMLSQSEAAYHNIQIAKSLGKPKLALQGGLRAAEGLSDSVRRSSAAELLLNFSVPILSGGENKSRVRQAALAQSRAVLETRDLQDNLNERIEQLWATVDAAKNSELPNLAQKNAAEKAYQAILLQRTAGVVTSLDVLSIEQTLLDSELNIIQANNTEAVARLQLLGLMGVL